MMPVQFSAVFAIQFILFVGYNRAVSGVYGDESQNKRVPRHVDMKAGI